MVQTMAHTCYRVADLEKSIKFYTEAFDFKVSRERDFKEYKFKRSNSSRSNNRKFGSCNGCGSIYSIIYK